MFSKKSLRIMIGLFCILLFSGCVRRTGAGGSGAGLPQGGVAQTTDTKQSVQDKTNSTDTVIITHIDTENSQITVKSISGDNLYILNYTAGSRIQNRYGTEKLMQEMELGEIADISYVAGSQKLISLKESDTAWENKSVSKWGMDDEKQQMQIGSDKYAYDDNLVVLSDGRQIDIHQLNAVDTLIVRGIGNKLCSVNVNTGHGYIRISGQDDLIGGLIEVGTKIMTVITEDMIIVAPEGSYTLTATKDKIGGSKEIEVTRDSETFVSLSEFKAEVQREGTVRFHILPEGIAYNIFVDDKAVNAEENVALSYGTHKLTITSSTYTDYTEELVISSVYMNKTIDLSKQEEETSTGETETTTTKTTGETAAASTTTRAGEETTTAKREDGVETTEGEGNNNYIVVSGPAGAEVYLDGVYQGTAPVTMKKVSGEHIFVIRKDGYKTTAYTYTFDTGTKDIYIKFPELETSDN